MAYNIAPQRGHIFVKNKLSHALTYLSMPLLYVFLLYHTNFRYMKRRCWFLDNFPAYNYNTGAGVREGTGEVTNTRRLGSMLMEAMLSEAEQFCHPCIWEGGDYCQVR